MSYFHGPFIKFVSNVHVRVFLDCNITLPIQCIGYTFVHKKHNLIKKDNLKGTNNKKPRKCFSRCLNYCENRTVDYKKDKESIITRVKSYIQCWWDKHCVKVSFLSEKKQAGM